MMLDLSAKDAHLIRSILHRYIPDHIVWAFGSRVKGKAKPFSDLDLAIVTAPLAADTRLNLQEAFDDAPLAMKIDLVLFDQLPDSLRNDIIQHHIVFFDGTTMS